MGFQTRFVQHESQTFAANAITSSRINRGMILREIVLQLSGTFTDATNTAALVLRGDEWGPVREIRVVINGNDVIRIFSGNDLWWLNYFLYGTRPQTSAAVGDGAAAAAATFSSTLTIPFWMPGTVRPMDTALDTSRLSDIRVEVTWGAITDLSAATTAYAATLRVASLQCFDSNASKPGYVPPTFSMLRMSKIVRSVGAANTAEQQLLTVGPMYRGILIGNANSTATLDVANNITNIKVLSGTNVFRDIRGDVLQAWQRQRTNTQTNVPVSGARAASALSLEPRRGTTANLLGGWYWLDFVQDGFLTECIDTVGFSELTLELNMAAAAQLTIIPLQIYPPRG